MCECRNGLPARMAASARVKPTILALVERSQHLAARMMRDDEQRRRHGDLFAPDGMFEADALFVFRERRAVADFDFAHGKGLSHRERTPSIRDSFRSLRATDGAACA